MILLLQTCIPPIKYANPTKKKIKKVKDNIGITGAFYKSVPKEIEAEFNVAVISGNCYAKQHKSVAEENTVQNSGDNRKQTVIRIKAYAKTRG